MTTQQSKQSKSEKEPELTELQQKVAALPLEPGVYRFFDDRGKLLYIGKATKLRQRVQSYFRASTKHSGAKQRMVSLITDVQVTVVDSEPEALLLETTLIKKHKPPYNVVMKDDKSFQYIHITADAYPQIERVRNLPLRGRTGRYYGPYTSGRALRRTLRLLKQIFRYCENPPVEKKGKMVLPKRPCLDYHLERCIGPCAGDITPEEYTEIIGKIESFLQGNYQEVRTQVQREMYHAAEDQKFEKAARLRDQVEAIDQLMVRQEMVSTKRENADYLSLAREGSKAAVNIFAVRNGMMINQQVVVLKNTADMDDEEVLSSFKDQYYAHTMTPPSNIYLSTQDRRGRNRRLLEMGEKNALGRLEKEKASFEKQEERAMRALNEVADALDTTVEKLHRIEIYDISNFQGKYSVGSMVVFIDGRPEPSEYRKFKIKTVEGPNDFASLREVMDRRLGHLPQRVKKEKDAWPRPDLIIIDGGKGQLSAASAIINIMAPDLRVVSLAKREEEIFLPEQKDPILLEKGSEGFHLIQRMRDEAHRFAIGFYRRRHMKGLLE